MEIYGYIRISCKDQCEDRQIIQMRPFHIPPANLFIDKQSGKNFNRPKYQCLLKKLQRGDLLYVQATDRLGRNYGEILEQWRYITKSIGADIRVINMLPLLDTTYCKDLLGTFVADIVLHILSMSAQLERESLLERQAQGIAAAKARGVAFGKPAYQLPAEFDAIFSRWREGVLSAKETANLCRCSVRTLYRRTEKLRGKEGFIKGDTR